MEDPKYLSESERANFLKNWEDAKPKVTEGMFNAPIIYGTGGESYMAGIDPYNESDEGSKGSLGVSVDDYEDWDSVSDSRIVNISHTKLT